ncbi:Methionyl-tRNA formyltransferase [Pseudonocardia sp. Ae168_Ps1]|uniref:methionyl-tRNA formyltransferase n=1 Tax=unclassified Pseudonocardia TaxID=2619320 RepID=UPI00094AF076|nr:MULTISPECIES: methionyl-tRNA formyltransferase [unclassified Pseudonocardia]OLL72531.1 Methionyl-tRNA formyltransferase [Pseudonocardia sp. Ae150A_Ps1]OLL78503.1 Methionyl-tRNA formyltransferase [Pseudonocardia sp. Ae168_Ps1]OLL87372.1 Methionyl-tRNA formyltransferase [Pseudonocardia sp. Ae263_Ps1]OLL92599.1 Methionyl-tRNA formyltransferase [Pseudonocardia sp. Ae356_Ps1]
MRLLFAGTPEPAVPALRALLDSPRHDVVAVLTRPDAPSGRGRRLTRSPVGALADEAGIPVLTPAKPAGPEFVEVLRELAPDCAPVVAYGALLPRAVLDVPAHGWVNLHFSLLPAWRGAAPVQAALRHGDDVTGATTFRLEEGMDTGPTFGVVTETVGGGDTAGALLGRLAESGAKLLTATLDGIEDGTVEAVPQPAEGVSLAPKVTPADARVDLASPATAIDRLVRSVTPEPGAWCEFRDDRLGLGPVRPLRTGEVELAPGELRVERRRVLAGTSTVPVELGEVKPKGKRLMPAPDWARGARIEPGEYLR